MKARILARSEEELWQGFLEQNPNGTIHQTPQWGDFQRSIPSRGKTWIIVLEEDSKIVGGGMLVRHKLPKGFCWLYCARGPILDFQNPSYIQAFLSQVKEIARQEKAVFLRIDPLVNFTASGFSEITYGFQPEHTLIVDLCPDESQILAQMKPKGRYNIRLAEKKGVEIRKSKIDDSLGAQEDLAIFFDLLKQTTERDSFSGHGQEYYQSMLSHLGRAAALYFADFQGQALAAALITYHNETATYYYGVSGNQHRHLMAPYLLHWQIMRDAKAAGYKNYDLFGIAPENAKNHPWAGVTAFKQKFGGMAKHYPHAKEYPFKKLLYLLYRIYKKL